jgi:hypothetical protein
MFRVIVVKIYTCTQANRKNHMKTDTSGTNSTQNFYMLPCALGLNQLQVPNTESTDVSHNNPPLSTLTNNRYYMKEGTCLT